MAHSGLCDHRQVRQKLITDRWREPALWAVGVSAAVVAVIGVMVFHGASTRFDASAYRVLAKTISWPTAHRMIHMSSPLIGLTLVASAVVIALVLRRWPLVVFAIVAPLLALLITEQVLKPFIGRLRFRVPDAVQGMYSAQTVYPSGHETGVAATALTLFVVAVQLRLGRRSRAALAAVLLAWTAMSGIALARTLLHFATDVIGAIGVSVVAVLGLALIIDQWLEPVAHIFAPERGPGKAISAERY